MIEKILKDKAGHALIWSRLLEVSFGELSNWQNKKWNYELAEKYKPEVVGIRDVSNWNALEDLPKNWAPYLEACIEKYGLK